MIKYNSPIRSNFIKSGRLGKYFNIINFLKFHSKIYKFMIICNEKKTVLFFLKLIWADFVMILALLNF